MTSYLQQMLNHVMFLSNIHSVTASIGNSSFVFILIRPNFKRFLELKYLCHVH